MYNPHKSFFYVPSYVFLLVPQVLHHFFNFDFSSPSLIPLLLYKVRISESSLYSEQATSTPSFKSLFFNLLLLRLVKNHLRSLKGLSNSSFPVRHYNPKSYRVPPPPSRNILSVLT